MTDAADLSAVELAAAFGAGTLSPVEACQAALDRIERHDGAVNAFAYVIAEEALEAARASEARWQRGEPLGPIDGVPSTIKELTPVKGVPMNRASLAMAEVVSDEDAPVTARMRAAGAVIIGTTTSPEFGWKGITHSPARGITRNPWDTSTTPGGSSGGAAAAAVLGMGVLHQGSDAGGSIRIPCGFSGIFGIKPTYGWVAQVPPSAMTWLSHIGPMTRTVEDSVLMLQTIAGGHPGDWYVNPPAETPDWRASLRDGIAGLRVAYSPALGYADVHSEVAEAVKAAVGVLGALGAEISEVDPGFDSPLADFNTLWWSGAAKIAATMTAEERARLDPGFAEFAERGARISAAEYLAADAARAALGARMAYFHQQYDLLVTPSLPIPAFAAGVDVPEGGPFRDWPEWTPFSYPFNMTQQPACSVPCGLTSAGLPVGLHIVGPKFRDDLLLRAAAAYEAAAPAPRISAPNVTH